MMHGATRGWAYAAVAAASVLLSTEAAQSAPVVVGYLTCTIAAETGTLTAGQGRDGICTFRPGRHGPEETYIGTMQGAGASKALFDKGTVMLAVKASPETELRPGLLQQDYAAEAGGASAAAVPLVGANDKSIVLQPLNEVEGRVAAGKSLTPDAVLVLIELKLAATAG